MIRIHYIRKTLSAQHPINPQTQKRNQCIYTMEPPHHASSSPLTLYTLPTVIHLLLLDNLDVTPSTCLGLNCKLFYGLHYQKHGKVPLLLDDPWTKHVSSSTDRMFPDLLKTWMSPKDMFSQIVAKTDTLWYDRDLRCVFMTEEQYRRDLPELVGVGEISRV